MFEIHLDGQTYRFVGRADSYWQELEPGVYRRVGDVEWRMARRLAELQAPTARWTDKDGNVWEHVDNGVLIVVNSPNDPKMLGMYGERWFVDEMYGPLRETTSGRAALAGCDPLREATVEVVAEPERSEGTVAMKDLANMSTEERALVLAKLIAEALKPR